MTRSGRPPASFILLTSNDSGGSGPAILIINTCAHLVAFICGLVDLPYGILAKLAHPCRDTSFFERVDTECRRRRGLIIILGGVEGPSIFNSQMAYGLVRGRVRAAIRRIDWNDGPFLMRSAINLMSPTHHQRQAQRVADAIIAYRQEYPNGRVSLIAQSGGCWIAVRAIELLPENLRISTCVLLASAISPGRDHAIAGARCTNRLYSFKSIADWFYLGFGTTVFGTSDRRHRPATGQVGMANTPPGVNEISWRPAWMRWGYVGNHTSSTSPAFVRSVVAPLMRD